MRKLQWHPIPVLLPGKSHGWRSLVGRSPRGREESDTTEQLHFHFSLSCIGEGNGNPLQCSCLENPRDGGAWWAAVYEVAQSRTRLKRLSSSSSSTVQQLAYKGWGKSTEGSNHRAGGSTHNDSLLPFLADAGERVSQLSPEAAVPQPFLMPVNIAFTLFTFLSQFEISLTDLLLR